MKKRIILTVLIACTALSGTACGKKNEVVKKAEPKEEKIEILGKKTDTSSDVILINKTERSITGVAVKEDAGEFKENLISDNKSFKADEKRELCYDSEQTEQNTSKETSESAASSVVQYDVQLTFEDGEIAVLTDVPIFEIEETELYYDEGVAYIEYSLPGKTEKISTKDSEIALKKTKEEEAKAAEEAKKAEEEAKKKAEEAKSAESAQGQETQNTGDSSTYEEPYYDNSPVYEEPSYDNGQTYEEPSYDNSPVYEEPQSSDDSGDSQGGCLDGALLW